MINEGGRLSSLGRPLSLLTFVDSKAEFGAASFVGDYLSKPAQAIDAKFLDLSYTNQLSDSFGEKL
jgi:hypothetical protein